VRCVRHIDDALEAVVSRVRERASRTSRRDRSADSIILALRARFQPGAAHGLQASYELRLGEDRFQVDVADDEIRVARRDAHQVDATIETEPDTLNRVLWGAARSPTRNDRPT
jgi:hypothetical protein